MVAGRLGGVAAPTPRRAAQRPRSRRTPRRRPVPRALVPDDLYRLRIPTDPRISPDGLHALVTVQTAAPKRDGYRHAIWLVPLDADRGEPRQLAVGARNAGGRRGGA